MSLPRKEPKIATIKSEVQTAASHTVTSLSTLASATYCVSAAAINHSTNDPLDVLVDASVTVGTTTGNKQIVIFAKASIDGTDFSTGPETGTTTTDEPDLYFVGVIPANVSSVAHRRVFSLAAAFGGVLPTHSKLVFKNDSGAALTAASVQLSEVWGVSAA